MHIIQVLRSYLGLTQQELARKAGITQPDLCEMEIKEPYAQLTTTIAYTHKINDNKSKALTQMSNQFLKASSEEKEVSQN